MRNGVIFALLALSQTACLDDEIVYRDRDFTEGVPSAAAGFLGYHDIADTLTVCGNCHVGQQASWQRTSHASAFATLEESGESQPFCRACHTVSERGNATEAVGGFAAVPDDRYQDVQCESCHGPGLEHVTNPDATQPLAHMTVQIGGSTGCGECHSGVHHPFVDQWAASAHGRLPHGLEAGMREGCNQCHNGRVALVAKFKETDDYVEKDTIDVMPITCGVCHDPHGSDFEANLRAPLSEPSMEQICVTCHSRSAAPTSWSSRGPHSPQGLLVLGINAGWIPPGFQHDSLRIVSSHGTAANPKLCATCHVSRFSGTDTAGVAFTSVGHSFEATPCMDAAGRPTTGPCGVAQESFAGCTASGCHGSEATARSAFITTRARLNRLLDELWTDADGDRALETTDGGLLPNVLEARGLAELDPSTPVITAAKGAIWNALLAFTSEREQWRSFTIGGKAQSSHKGSGDGVHNPFLLEALLLASIDEIESRYGTPASHTLERAPQLRAPPAR